MKKLLSIMLSMVIAFGGLSVFAENPSSIVSTHEIKGVFEPKTIDKAQLFEDTTTFNYTEVYNAILQTIQNRNLLAIIGKTDDMYNLYTVEYTQANYEGICNIYYDVINTHPEYFYALPASMIQLVDVDTDGNVKTYISGILPQYFENITNADILYFNNKVDAIINAIIKPEMTEEQKVLAIHDYIAENTIYGYKVTMSQSGYGTTDDIVVIPTKTQAMIDLEANDQSFAFKNMASHTAYGTIIQGVGVCQSYAQTLKLFLDKLDIPCINVESTDMVHQWNLVQLDDVWYHVDITWDDPVIFDSETDITQIIFGVYHDYFLLSDSKISEGELDENNNVINNHYGWTQTYQCLSTKYQAQNYGFNNITSTMYYNNGNFYYKTNDDYYKKPFDGAEVATTKDEYDIAVDANQVASVAKLEIPTLPQNNNISTDIYVQAGKSVSSITMNTLKDIGFELKNSYSDTLNVDLWVAYYNNGQLVGCGLQNANVDSGNRVKISVPTALSTNATEAKVFFLNGQSTGRLTPFIQSFSIN